MKINAKINKQVNESVANCRKVFEESTIEMLKMLGAKPTEEVKFFRTMILFQQDGKKSATLLADRIYYCEREGCTPFYMISMEKDHYTTSSFLSLSNLFLIYKEVRALVNTKQG